MYRTEIYSEEEYLDYLQKHPMHNLLMTNLGMVNLSGHDPTGHLKHPKKENFPIYKKNVDDKKAQS